VSRDPGGEVHRRRRFANATLLIRDAENAGRHENSGLAAARFASALVTTKRRGRIGRASIKTFIAPA